MTAVQPPDAPAAPSTAPAARQVVRWTVVGMLLLVVGLMADVQRLGGNPIGFVQPGAQGPSVEVFAEDFPDLQPPEGVGLDGQMTYAVARDRWPLDAAAEHLDRPRYRLQRPLLPWVAGGLHPGAGGLGLVWTIVVVNLTAVAVGAWAVGRLSTHWGGPAWLAAVFPLLPGTFMSVRVSTSDAAAVALALLAVWLAERGRPSLAVAAGVAAVLTKEPAWLVLAGWALAHRSDRRQLAVAVVPGVVAAAWMVVLRLRFPGAESLGSDLGPPFVGLITAATDLWLEGREMWGLVGTVLGLVLGGAALVRGGLRHPLGWAVALNLGFVLIAGSNPLGTSFGGTRTSLALTALAVIVLATPHARRDEVAAEGDHAEHDDVIAAGRDDPPSRPEPVPLSPSAG